MTNNLLPDPSTFVCPSCGKKSVGQYCTNCGERKLGTESRSLRYFLDVIIDFLTSFDSKGYRSLWYLIFKPGFLSEEQLRGSRVRYAKPLSLFISINVVYYLSISVFGANTFTTPLAVQLHQNDYYAGFAGQQVEHHLKTDKLSYATLETNYNQKAGVLSKTLIFLFIPIYAIIFYGLFFNRQRYFIEHTIVATHFWSFILLLLAVVVPVIAVTQVWLLNAQNVATVLAANDNPISIFIQICITVYLALMLHRVYKAKYWYCIAVAVLLAWAFFHIVWLYRFFLFVITLHSI